MEYEGEFLNGKRNGKGKEYSYDGEFIFEGEYLDGKRNGKAKESSKDGIILFEGEYLNDEIWNGKEFYPQKNGDIVEITYLNGNKSKKAKVYNNNSGKLIFKGEFTLKNKDNSK